MKIITNRLFLRVENDHETGEPVVTWVRYGMSFRLPDAIILRDQLTTAIADLTAMQAAEAAVAEELMTREYQTLGVTENCVGPNQEQRGSQL